MVVFLESDLLNADMENAKIKQLEEIMSHLAHRVKNSKGTVKAPAVQLLDILNQDKYATFQNQQVKRHVTERIHQFLKDSIENDFPKSEDIGLFKVALTGLKSQTLPILEKIRLYVLVLYRMQVGYLAGSQEDGMKELVEKLKELFEGDKTLKQAYIHFSLLFVIASYPGWPNNLLPIFNGQMLAYWKDDAKTTQLKFEQAFLQTVFKLLQQQELFETKDCIPLLVVASAKSAPSAVVDVAKSYLNTLQLDTEDLDMSAFLYSMIFGKFDMFFHQGEGNLIQQPPFEVKKHLLYYLLKFPGAITQSPFNLNLVDHCLFNGANVDQL